MKIDSSLSKTITAPNGEARVVRAPRPEAKNEAGASDEVSLSSSSQLQALSSGLGEDQPVDTAKVEAIKQAIAEGRFKINPERIADRLLASVKELLTNQK